MLHIIVPSSYQNILVCNKGTIVAYPWKNKSLKVTIFMNAVIVSDLQQVNCLENVQ